MANQIRWEVTSYPHPDGEVQDLHDLHFHMDAMTMVAKQLTIAELRNVAFDLDRAIDVADKLLDDADEAARNQVNRTTQPNLDRTADTDDEPVLDELSPVSRREDRPEGWTDEDEEVYQALESARQSGPLLPTQQREFHQLRERLITVGS